MFRKDRKKSNTIQAIDTHNKTKTGQLTKLRDVPKQQADNPRGSAVFLPVPSRNVRVMNVIGKGNFGEVRSGIIVGVEDEDLGSSVAMKYSTKPNENYDEKEVLTSVSIKKRNEDFLRKSSSSYAVSDAKKEIVIPTPIKIIDEEANKKTYTLACPLAEHGDLKDFLYHLGHDQSKIKDKRIVEAFRADPAGVLLVFCAKMRQALSAFHKYEFIHADVATRNFLVFSFKNEDFKWDENGKIIGLKLDSKNGFIRISDLGLAQDLRNSLQGLDSKIVVNSDLAIRWLDDDAIKKHELSIMSDMYAFRCTIVTMLGLIMGVPGEASLLTISGDITERLNDFLPKRVRLDNRATLRQFVHNIEAICIKTKTDLLERDALSQDDIDRIKLAHACLVFINAFRSYLVSVPGLGSPDYKPTEAMVDDGLRFYEAAINLITKQEKKDQYAIDDTSLKAKCVRDSKKEIDTPSMGPLEEESKYVLIRDGDVPKTQTLGTDFDSTYPAKKSASEYLKSDRFTVCRKVKDASESEDNEYLTLAPLNLFPPCRNKAAPESKERTERSFPFNIISKR